MEFAHKSFGEFLCAERLKETMLDWTSKIRDRRGERDQVATEVMDRQIYDLLGYGGLTREIVDYLMALLEKSDELDPLRLFQRLEQFYWRWCAGEFIDADPPTLPQQTMQVLRKQLGDRENPLGQRQVDVYTGLNVMILLLELHRYAQNRIDLKDQIVFYPSGQVAEGERFTDRLLQVMYYSDCLNRGTFGLVAGSFLASANLSSTNLSRADLIGANLSNANLSNAYLSRANLVFANLAFANLAFANLDSANLDNANLSRANLSRANLNRADLNSADLNSADLNRANLNRANLAFADLNSADLNSANLDSANLDKANLSSANLDSANLSSANLDSADLTDIVWDAQTNWEGAQGLETAENVPEALKQQLGIKN